MVRITVEEDNWTGFFKKWDLRVNGILVLTHRKEVFVRQVAMNLMSALEQ